VVRQTWWSPRAIKLHLVILIIVPTFAGLCAWQVDRALSGNDLSWAYVFEWPFFAGYAVYMWWRFLHETPLHETPRRDSGSTVAGPTEGPAPPAAEGADLDADADERAAYNRYLAQLATQDKRKQWR
jgi:hypothetical protein